MTVCHAEHSEVSHSEASRRRRIRDSSLLLGMAVL